MFGRVLQTVTRRTAQSGVRLYHEGGRTFPLPTYNDLYVPQGCWKESYNKNQTRYNIILLTGILSLAGTIALGRVNGWLYFNYGPPKEE